MAFKMLSGVHATGASPSLFLHEKCKDHTVEVDWANGNGTVTAMTVKLQGSAEGRGTTDSDANWFDLDTYALVAADLAAFNAMFHLINKVIQRVRVNITTLTGAGTTTSINVRYIPKVEV